MSFNHFLVFSLSLFLVSQAKEDRWTVFPLFLLVVLVEWILQLPFLLCQHM